MNGLIRCQDRLPTVDTKPKTPLHGVEIPIGVQQFMVIQKAIRPDNHIDGLANRDSAGSQLAKICRGRQGDVLTHEIRVWKIEKKFSYKDASEAKS